MASEEKNSSKLNFLNWILVIAIGLFLGLLVIYYLKIFDLDTTKKADWGTFGDFFGGTLNPIFALFSLFAIIYTIKIQTEELELSREELEATRKELEGSKIAQQEQSESLKLQNEATKLQMFENTFFKLLEIHMLELKDLSLNVSREQSKLIINKLKYNYLTEFDNLFFGNLLGKIVIINLLKFFKIKFFLHYEEFNLRFENITGIYFGQIYQILKFIDDSNIENKQRYINIFRAQFTKDELEFLFYHCLGAIGKRKFKKLVEDYEFFEHIILDIDIERQLLIYDKKAFGKNENILKIYDELKEKAKTEEIPAFVKAE
jgi:hypothetical protein